MINKKLTIGSIILAVLLLIVGVLTSLSIYSVDAGETAIVTRYGEIVDTKTSGLNWKSPVEDVTFFSTREAKIEFGEFDKRTGDVIAGLSAYTSDRQTATVALTLTYQITNPEQVYTKYKTTDNMLNTLVAPRVRQQLEIVFSKYTAMTAVERRGEFATALRKEISDIFKGYPLTINDVQSVFNFSKEYERMIEDSVNKDVAVRNQERQTRIAQEQAREAQVRAESEAKIKITQAEALAKEKTLQADAEAHAIRVKGEAEAASARALAEALSKNQDLVALKTAEKWNGVLPTYIPQGTVMPFVQLPQK
ncbi:SPFH domain-containing protein [Volucribacter amazonae]|uniref:Protease regulator protein HflK n=1 Tax=Volucribacter amazonae TaxID=256731 RepID=A0A9X4PBR0_9PAST|nr:prohibitin family protein [Volucribacter amazonae]MDG6894631.1 protease regulator protein HflK [Volucribacter amazonae]